MAAETITLHQAVYKEVNSMQLPEFRSRPCPGKTPDEDCLSAARVGVPEETLPQRSPAMLGLDFLSREHVK